MMKWQKVKLGDYLSKVKTGKLDANASCENGAYPFFTCAIDPLKIDTYSYDCECVLVAGNGDLNVKYYEGKFDAYQRTYILESKDKKQLNVKFLYYFMRHYLDNLRLQAFGGIIKYIRLNNIIDAQIPLPPKEEQERIAKELDAVSDLLAKQKQLLTEQDTLIKSVFYDMFGDPVTNDKGWSKHLFKDVIDYIGDIGSNGSNATVAKHLIMKDEEDYALMVRTLNFNANDFIHNVKYVAKDVYDFFLKSQIFGGEIIMNKIGSAGSFWLMPYLNRPVSLGLNQIMIRLQKNANTKYIYYFYKTDYGQYNISKSLRGAVTKSITKGAVKNLILYLPPLPLQQKFADIVEQIEVQKQKIKSAITETETLFNALMAKYFDEE